MFMGASTGCNTVYGSTPPSNPHPYPWMNSLFQDGSTISWLLGESLIQNHSRRSVVPERLCDALLNLTEDVVTELSYFTLTHLEDALMTDQEIRELPKVWVVGGDGALGDIGFQNVSKVILQNRPNVKMLMLDTQVYSNTGGQASTSTFMGQNTKMSVHGKEIAGKTERRKELAQIVMAHPDVFVAQTTAAHINHFYKAVMRANEYKGPAVIITYTTCQPEHGVGDHLAGERARLAVDSRTFPLMIYDPEAGERIKDRLSLKGNPALDKDWYVDPKTNERTDFVTFARGEGRFEKHFDKDGNASPSLQLGNEDRRKNWRMLQEMAGIDPEGTGKAAVAPTPAAAAPAK
jgi:pyruvate-ferredoxin/flavodoxin oxidoreductase